MSEAKVIIKEEVIDCEDIDRHDSLQDNVKTKGI